VYALLSQYETTRNIEELQRIENELVKLRYELRTDKKTHKLDERPEYFLNEYKTQTPVVTNTDNEFTLTLNQRFLKKYMSLNTSNKSLLLFHGVGVGKTCAAIQIAENFTSSFSNMGKTLILSSVLLRSNFDKELFKFDEHNKSYRNTCMLDKYVKMVHNYKKLPKNVLLKKVHRIIAGYYEFSGYLQLANRINKKKNKFKNKPFEYRSYIRDTFSNRVLIIDEVHNIRSIKDNRSGKLIPTIIEDIIKYTKNLRLIYLTATPMFDDYKEIIWIVNTLRNNERESTYLDYFDPDQALFDDKGAMYDDVRDILVEFANNHVSYMRGETPLNFPLRLYPSINNDERVMCLDRQPKIDVYDKKIRNKMKLKHIELITSLMSESQYEQYKAHDYKQTEQHEDVDENKSNKQSIRVQLSNVYFPVNKKSDELIVGRNAVRKLFDESSNKKQYSLTYKDNSIRIFDQDNLHIYAPKINTILDYIKNAEGIVVVYSKYIYSGLIPMALALESVGFNRFRHPNLLSNNSTGMQTKHKYTIISGNKEITPENSKQKDIETISSIDNTNGDEIKVVLISEVASEGVDFKNIREIHLLEPWYNMSKVEQIIGRGVRNNSHINLEESKRNVTIYLHVNMIPLSNKKKLKESVDCRMYRLAGIKQEKISQIERILKQGAIDCRLNKEISYYNPNDIVKDVLTSQGVLIKGHKIGDEDNSKLCDYTKCTYECIPRHDGKKDLHGDVHYNAEIIEYDVDVFKRRIQTLFRNNITLDKPYLTYVEIVSELIKSANDNENLLKFALDKMITEKNTFDVKDQEGRLVYNSDKYIFHPLDLEDTKVPIKCRHRYTKNRPLNVRFNKSKSNINDKHVTDIASTSNDDEGSPYKEIVHEFNVHKDKLTKIIPEDKLDESIVWSMYIDKMTKQAYQSFMTILREDASILTSNKSLQRCLEDAGSYEIRDDALQYYYDFFDDKVIVVNDKVVKKTTHNLNNIKNKMLQNIDANIQRIRNDDDIKVLGFVNMPVGNQSTSFKMADKNVLKRDKKNRLYGQQCIQTAQFTTQITRRYVQELLDSINKEIPGIDKLKKTNLCLLYEYLLRDTPDLFLHPLQVQRFKVLEKN
jgi:hypothetical protein